MFNLINFHKCQAAASYFYYQIVIFIMNTIMVIKLFCIKTQENLTWICKVFKNMFILIIFRENFSHGSYFFIKTKKFLGSSSVSPGWIFISDKVDWFVSDSLKELFWTRKI